MLRLLLDEHLSDDIAAGVRSRAAEITIVSLQDWQGGVYLGVADDVRLQAAHAQGMTLVTFDQRTILPLLREWGERGVAHGGVIFGSRHTFATNDFGAIVQELVRLWNEQGRWDWANRIVYLAKP